VRVTAAGARKNTREIRLDKSHIFSSLRASEGTRRKPALWTGEGREGAFKVFHLQGEEDAIRHCEGTSAEGKNLQVLCDFTNRLRVGGNRASEKESKPLPAIRRTEQKHCLRSLTKKRRILRARLLTFLLRKAQHRGVNRLVCRKKMTNFGGRLPYWRVRGGEEKALSKRGTLIGGGEPKTLPRETPGEFVA